MTEFYSNLWEKKLSKVEALRQAQLTMLRRYDPKSHQLRSLGTSSAQVGPKAATEAGQPHSTRLHPRFWAAFQLSGDWR